ncbi:MAG TPA: hypothetical protein VJ161_13105 [Geobacteraceae bacterium]|nr:hypothetical protein [Geobacteraceae bacterium]
MSITRHDSDMGKEESFKEPYDISFKPGGPFNRLLVLLRLSDPALGLLKRRIICISLFAWLPLLLLSLFGGTALGGVSVPFLFDIETHARLLLAVPLLIGAELLAGRRIREIIGQFLDRRIIPEESIPRFGAIIDSTNRLKNSVVVECLLIILVYVVGHFFWSTMSGMAQIVVKEASTWYAVGSDSGLRLSPAGYWYVLVSRPIFQFLFIRWYFIIFVWARFLWKISRLNLCLIPSHPDRAAGLGFLTISINVMALLILAHGVILSGSMAYRIFFGGAKFTDFSVELIGGTVLVVLVVLGPLIAFIPHLLHTKRMAVYGYGTLGSRYVERFDRKWVRGDASADTELLGSADIQSLADLGNSYEIIRGLRLVPFGKEAVFGIVVIFLLPILPLALTMMPVEELIRKLLGAVF